MGKLSRRKFLSTAAGAVAVASLPKQLKAQAAANPPRKPNVLFIMSDDMRTELGCYGSRFGVQSPNLDALAQSGVRFDRNYCQFPLCNPSRSSLLTGRHPTTTGVLGNTTRFRDKHPDYVSLPELFRQNGYVTLRSGKIYHGGIDDPKAWDVGYGIMEGPGGAGGHTLKPTADGQIPATKPSDLPAALPQDLSRAAESDRMVLLDGMGEGNGDYHSTDTIIGFLNKYKDQPFFIGCGYSKPHSPPAAPEKFYDLYDLSKIELTPDFAAWPTVPPGFPTFSIRPRNADLFIGRAATESEAKQVIRAYIASISWVDFNIGRVLAELDKLGLRDNTIVSFVCDHGYQLGEKGKWSKAGSLFENGTRVPLILHVPWAKGNGTACTRIVQSVDIYATIAELCGLPLPPGNEGRSLTPLLSDPTAAWDQPAFSVWSEDGTTLHGTAIRTEKWRYAEFGPNGSNGAMLFDPHTDPLEMKNLANDPQYASVVAELSPLVKKYASNLGKTQV
jgi:arylsulfatase A-like enzyme